MDIQYIPTSSNLLVDVERRFPVSPVSYMGWYTVLIPSSDEREKGEEGKILSK